MRQRLQVKRRLALALIGAALAACSTGDRLGDTQVRPTDRPECLVGSQRQDLSAGVPTLIGAAAAAPTPTTRVP